MFGKSAKTREEFYTKALVESSVHIEIGGIEIGETAAAFKEVAMGSMHQKHLSVWYSARPLLQAR